ncbi:ABC transporter substrate-binding protein [Nonomuraea fuscirosea]|jgi:ABC-type branched-subunit amino acid transport system substrate-binding protein|uniref:Amino acid/amide ABC transporter substrate-binding protein (HAAT family) n=1 Tax=Nonomuraea fuscirosea TaxID=1291556 RepID=A0A2T0MVB5_9ACTN|nr:ABC transporter substrate-binding protein [Nonomuraea fuscirosea]PRX62742.1 amino acid/amide ABC transporter substrate-binding protein (HAAT family) [Nonomuraea fuscirosea]WSA47889.1 ABC transporter substrate-binding protein [Nonomuraea fuscirosea]
MMRIAPAGRLLAVAAAASLALTACGGGGDTAAEQSGTAAPSTAASSAPAAAGDGTLTIGTVLPQTGSLAFLGPPEFAGVDQAVKEINEAGGVLGKPVEKQHTDSGDTTTNIASQSVDKLLAQKADAIIGAASSSVSESIIDKITGAGVVQFSPANTSDKFSTISDNGLYFRTAPPDKLQGRVLGDLIAADGNDTIGIMAMQDSYGSGLADQVTKTAEEAGASVVERVDYDPKAAEFSADVAKIKAKNPKAIVLIGFEEGAKVVAELVKQGLTADKHKWYMVDGNMSNTNYLKMPKGTLKGVKGTIPGAEAPDAFRKKLLELNPELDDFTYAAESYDATNLIALAAEAAKDDTGKSIAAKLPEVSKGGEKCKSFKECADLLKAGKDIDYDGVSGPIEFNEAGDPAVATIGVYEYGDDNKYPGKALEYRTGNIEG